MARRQPVGAAPLPAPAPARYRAAMSVARMRRDSPFAYHCAACSHCCHHYAIKVNPYEVWRLARRLGLSTTEFQDQHLADGPILRRRPDGACVFLGAAGCTVHPDRPLVCRLYPLARHLDAAGDETFTELAPHPQSAGSHGGDGTVDDYLQGQGAGPYLEAVDQYLAAFQRLQARLEDQLGFDDDLRQEARAVGTRQLVATPAGLLDPDPTLRQHCARHGLPLPTTPDAALQLHLAAIDAWLRDDAD